jgi:protein-disulfide isomerase
MHHLLFENQRMLADDDIARYSRALGLNTPRLMREVFNGTHASRVQEDIQFAKANGITHSPTFFVNGKRCDGVLAFHTLLAEAALPSAPRIRIPSAAFL